MTIINRGYIGHKHVKDVPTLLGTIAQLENVSLKEVHLKVGISRTSVRSIMDGDYNLGAYLANKLADYCGCDIACIYGIESKDSQLAHRSRVCTFENLRNGISK